ncbi:uncharacterized protein BXZ73DRAFT_99165 [Epithele typhae]|uniref:uncharacterized protein n=1 Tax=Epithele typhae TaxID=378194 RepID=UPI00200894E2|nr:uncharacterized protein BXZ73DRAFT_99165 [Epithele typhae]KAH9940166.1 hypothetical protein BXZ73DRAFT_99165 [Epithele typhae]
MSVLTALMYCISTVYMGLSLYVNMIGFVDERGILDVEMTILDRSGTSVGWVEDCLQLVNCIIGDAIVCWRTWVLYGRDWCILIFPVSCIIGSIVSAFGFCVSLAKLGPVENFYTGGTFLWFLVFGACTFTPNFYSVVMISLKARALRKANIHILGRSKSWSALLIIIHQ